MRTSRILIVSVVCIFLSSIARAEEPIELLRKMQAEIEDYINLATFDELRVHPIIHLEPRSDEEMKALDLKEKLEAAQRNESLRRVAHLGSVVVAPVVASILRKPFQFVGGGNWAEADARFTEALVFQVLQDHAPEAQHRWAARERLNAILRRYPEFRFFLEPDLYAARFLETYSKVKVDPSTKLLLITELPILSSPLARDAVVWPAWTEELGEGIRKWANGAKFEEIPILSGSEDLRRLFVQVEKVDSRIYVHVSRAAMAEAGSVELALKQDPRVELGDFLRDLTSRSPEANRYVRSAYSRVANAFAHLSVSAGESQPTFHLVERSPHAIYSPADASVMKAVATRLRASLEHSRSGLLLTEGAPKMLEMAKHLNLVSGVERIPGGSIGRIVKPGRTFLENYGWESGAGLVALGAYLWWEGRSPDAVERTFREAVRQPGAVFRDENATGMNAGYLEKLRDQVLFECRAAAKDCVVTVPISETLLALAARVRTNKGITELRY